MQPFLTEQVKYLKQRGRGWGSLLSAAETGGVDPTTVVEVLYQADGGHICGLYDLPQAPYQVVARIIKEAEAYGGENRTTVVKVAKRDLLREIERRRNLGEEPDRLAKMEEAKKLLDDLFPDTT